MIEILVLAVFLGLPALAIVCAALMLVPRFAVWRGWLLAVGLLSAVTWFGLGGWDLVQLLWWFATDGGPHG